MEVRRQEKKVCSSYFPLNCRYDIWLKKKKNRDKVECSKYQSLVFFLITKWMLEQFYSMSLGDKSSQFLNKIYQMEVLSYAWHWVILSVFILIYSSIPLYVPFPSLPHRVISTKGGSRDTIWEEEEKKEHEKMKKGKEKSFRNSHFYLCAKVMKTLKFTVLRSLDK